MDKLMCVEYRFRGIGNRALVIFIPGYTLDENVFKDYETALADICDTLAVNPFIHSREVGPLSPDTVAQFLAQRVKEYHSTSVVLVGESLGFQIAVAATRVLANISHIYGLSPTLIPHNLTGRGGLCFQEAASFIIKHLPAIFYWPLIPFFCNPKGILFLRSIVGNYTYDSKFLLLAVSRNSRSLRTFWQTMVEPLRFYVNRVTTDEVKLSPLTPKSITLVVGQSDGFITTPLESRYRQCPYYVALTEALGAAVKETIVLPGGHEGFIENQGQWMPVIIDRIRRTV